MASNPGAAWVPQPAGNGTHVPAPHDAAAPSHGCSCGSISGGAVALSAAAGIAAAAATSTPATGAFFPPAVVTKVRDRYFVWAADDIVRLRSRGRVAITPIGQCALKTSTRGKAAAIPALLGDEEVWTFGRNGWIRMYDAATGREVDVGAELVAATARCSTRDLLRRAAFYDLWSKGYALTNGIKFGVDYLAYRGDPTTCHAAFMVQVMAEGEPITPLALLGRSRVATTALKICVLAYADLDAGMGTGMGLNTEAHAGQAGEATDGGAAPAHLRGMGVGRVRYEAFKRMGPGTAVFATDCGVAAMYPAEAEGEAPLQQVAPQGRGDTQWMGVDAGVVVGGAALAGVGGIADVAMSE
jgi:tRNA splicing endonuclease